jgi:hypothetical protein
MSDLSKKEIYLLAKQLKGKGQLGGNLSAMTKKQLIAHMKGAGLWDSIKNLGSKALERIKGVKDTIKQTLFFPPNQLKGTSEKTFNKYKGSAISKISVRREPVNSKVTSVINALTGGKLNSAVSDLSYDKLFHLYLVLTIDGKLVLVEKNERINITDNFDKNSNYESVDVGSVPDGLTFDKFLNTGREKMGDHDFFQYNAKTNNCQDFLIGLLSANGLLDEDTKKFIKQDMDALFERLPSWSSAAAQALTDLGGKLSSLIGRGKKKRRAKKRKTSK